MLLTETRDQHLLRSFFRNDPVAHLYQWGDLAAPQFEHTRWFAALEDGAVQAVLLLYTGLETPAVLPSGGADAIEQIIQRFWAELPERFYTKLDDEQEAQFVSCCALSERISLQVMGLDRFHPRPQPPRTLLRRLSPNQSLDAVTRLYRDYPGNFFEPAQLRSGLYTGAWMNGRLASIAGTHTFAPKEGVGVLGNIVTGTEYRGKGLCQATVSFLVRELRKEGCRHIGLHVEEANVPAIACYKKIGFRDHSKLCQFLASKKQEGEGITG